MVRAARLRQRSTGHRRGRQTLTDPLVAVVFGAWLFGETNQWNTGQTLAELACAGVITLARTNSSDSSSLF